MLLVTEKYRVAASIAKALGFNRFVDDHFENQQGDVVAFSSGHLFTLSHRRQDVYQWQTPERFNRLPRTLYKEFSQRDVFVRGANIPAQQLGSSLIVQMKQHDVIINAMDLDREGERIFYDLFNAAKTQAYIYRMDLSDGLTRRMICDAFANLQDGIHFKSRHYASQARDCSDFAYSLATQVLTYYGRSGELHPLLSGYRSAKASVVSIGSVQIPTLNLIARQCRRVEKNRVRKIHVPSFSAKVGRYKLRFEYDAKRSGTDETLLFQKNLGMNYLKVRNQLSDEVVVTQCKVTSYEVSPPDPHNQSSLQSAFSDLSPKEVSETLQSLYMKGLISYPRSDNRSLPDTQYSNGRLAALMESLAGNEAFTQASKFSSEMLNSQAKSLEFASQPPCVSKMEGHAHSAIVPTGVNSSNLELNENESRVYNEIGAQLVRAVSGVTTAFDLSLSVRFSDEALGVLGEQESVFTCVRTFGSSVGKLAELKSGDRFTALDLELTHISRDVPQYYLLNELPEKMRNVADEVSDPEIKRLLGESCGLGTSATRHTIIDNLIKRAYIEVLVEDDNRYVVATSKGLALLSVLPTLFTSIEIKALWEAQLQKIERCQSIEQAVEMRDTFISRAYDEVEYLCNLLNGKQLGSNKSCDQPADAKLQKEVLDRGQLLGLEPHVNLFKSTKACRNFLMANPAPYTTAQMRDLGSSGMDTDRNVMRDPRRVQMREVQQGHQRPPSSAQLLKATRLSQLVHVQIPPKAKKSAAACDEFIRLCESKRAPSIPQIRNLQKLAKLTKFPLESSMLQKRADVVRLTRELRKKIKQQGKTRK
ncbi:DNA topoisomerase [Vibrio agarivorans]|uniref:DNA topoisomerase n=1 Tax=Vibrio agarivorans TaxID=153622 RepID=UPI0025B4A61F|nr:DNA topoisomerase [Vibrio agarivorans]MDN3661056.1 DNA topoisomerase [Vibrio agarivorans]